MFLKAPEGYISELFVAESSRGQGIGIAQLNTVRSEAETRQCSRLMLITSRTRESYTRRFYAQQGWIERKEMANFILEIK